MWKMEGDFAIKRIRALRGDLISDTTALVGFLGSEGSQNNDFRVVDQIKAHTLQNRTLIKDLDNFLLSLLSGKELTDGQKAKLDMIEDYVEENQQLLKGQQAGEFAQKRTSESPRPSPLCAPSPLTRTEPQLAPATSLATTERLRELIQTLTHTLEKKRRKMRALKAANAKLREALANAHAERPQELSGRTAHGAGGGVRMQATVPPRTTAVRAKMVALTSALYFASSRVQMLVEDRDATLRRAAGKALRFREALGGASADDAHVRARRLRLRVSRLEARNRALVDHGCFLENAVETLTKKLTAFGRTPCACEHLDERLEAMRSAASARTGALHELERVLDKQRDALAENLRRAATPRCARAAQRECVEQRTVERLVRRCDALERSLLPSQARREWYPPDPAPDALQAAVRAVLLELDIPFRIRIRRISGDIFEADRPLRLALRHDGAPVLVGSGKTLQRYFLDLYAPLLCSRATTSGSPEQERADTSCCVTGRSSFLFASPNEDNEFSEKSTTASPASPTRRTYGSIYRKRLGGVVRTPTLKNRTSPDKVHTSRPMTAPGLP
eukprot:gnl/Chilomastix_cuspidata/4119.p1 GENE.gnl/Chilomastix_cuspidata/4119~~gnl/Chilomastix_cuspidata/4119.p1  ORF type:complete len:563 (+),score=17.92 gnl/Chilomastix_cuspidata/4119:67-1755(+)